MIYEIKNNNIAVKINSLGAELWSIQDNDKIEYLWQGEEYWKRKASNLFPYVGRFTEGKYTYEGKEYFMNIHGFARTSEFQVIEQTETLLTLALTANENTYEIYPFKFLFIIKYELDKNTLKITFSVKNNDEKVLYFGVGGHPGFFVPIENGLDFTDYYLEFDAVQDVERVCLSEDCYVTEGTDPFPLIDGTKIPLQHNMFDDDAIVLFNMPKTITLKSDKGSKSVSVSYPDMDYLGLWHWPKVEVPYVCIEPWTSLPSRKNIVEELKEKSDLISLEIGKEYQNQWTIKIN